MMSAFTVRLTDDVAAKLDLLAAKLARSPGDVAAKAIGDFVEREAWSLADIEAGLEEAKAGDFASPAEVSEVLARYTVDSAQK
jgi:predicted transcriptional regulator